jgi:hypothetical protein
MFQDRHLDMALNVIEPLWQDSDRFKQRAAAEILQGMLRGDPKMPFSPFRQMMLRISQVPNIGLRVLLPDYGHG